MKNVCPEIIPRQKILKKIQRESKSKNIVKRVISIRFIKKRNKEKTKMAVKEKNVEKKSRILEYLKESHKWENYVFLLFSVIVLLMGSLILSGALVVKEDFWLIGSHPEVFAWVLVGIAIVFTLYALYPFFKPAFPELKKITWLPLGKFIGNSIRVLLFLTIFALLFLLYDAFITQILARIF